MKSDGRSQDEVPDRRGIVCGSAPDRREEWELDRDCERQHLPPDPAHDDQKVGEEVLGRGEAEEEFQL